MDVGFRAHHGHALLKAESAVGKAREHGVNGGRGKGSVGVVQVELGTRTLLQERKIYYSQIYHKKISLMMGNFMHTLITG